MLVIVWYDIDENHVTGAAISFMQRNPMNDPVQKNQTKDSPILVFQLKGKEQ
jgi:hypothetical protein